MKSNYVEVILRNCCSEQISKTSQEKPDIEPFLDIKFNLDEQL